MQDLASSMVQAQALALWRKHKVKVYISLQGYTTTIARIQRLEVMQNVSVVFTFHNLSCELYCAYAYSDGVSHIESACG